MTWKVVKTLICNRCGVEINPSEGGRDTDLVRFSAKDGERTFFVDVSVDTFEADGEGGMADNADVCRPCATYLLQLALEDEAKAIAYRNKQASERLNVQKGARA